VVTCRVLQASLLLLLDVLLGRCRLLAMLLRCLLALRGLCTGLLRGSWLCNTCQLLLLLLLGMAKPRVLLC
jgi:hypothetical protein